MTAQQLLIVLAGILLVVAALLAVWRLARGPSSLDRGVAADVVLAVLIAAVGAHAMWTRDPLGLPVILVLSLLGFTGAVGVARLITRAARDKTLYERAEAGETSGEGTP